jgi:hypothetical protein
MSQVTTLYLIMSTVRIGPLEYRKGTTAYLTAAQVTAVGAGNVRAVNNPLNTNGSHAASETHDTLGEASGVSNSS